MGVADGSAVVGHDIGDLVFADNLSLDLAQLEGGFLGVDADGLESSLDVVKDSEVLTSLGERDDVHNTERESVVTTDLTVDLDVAGLVLADLESLLAGKGVLKSVTEQD